jgi:hypothetical protein
VRNAQTNTPVNERINMKKLLTRAFAVAVAASLLVVPSALAASHNPKGEFAEFKECPLNNAEVENCVYSVSSGGSFKVGKKTVPLVNPVILQGGIKGAGEEVQFYGAENGDTLSKTPQPVPGGLTGIVAPTWWPSWAQAWFNGLINEGFTGVTATVELAAPATSIKLNLNNLIAESGTALGLPVKIKLSNAILGNNCYLGSNSKPIQINFTTGTSGSLKGALGEVSFNEAFSLVTIKGGRLVNNTFAAPGVSGCGGLFSFLVDPLVNEVLGVPSASGTNSAILEGVLKQANAGAVKASE